MNGSIVRVIPEKGFGFIRADDGGNTEYFFHRSALGRVPFGELRGGERVTFEQEQSDRGPRARAVEVL